MADEFNGVYANGLDEIAKELRQEFLDETKEIIINLDLLLDGYRNERNPENEVITGFSRAALKLRAQAGTIGMRLIGSIAHRLEDYMSSMGAEILPRSVEDLQTFIDRLEDVVEGRLALDSDAASLMRELPVNAGFSVEDVDVRTVEVMLVMLHGAANHYVQRELQQCGYRVTTVSTVLEAFPLVVQTKPDLIIISAMMPELDGIDLAIGLSSMSSTRNIPLALISSLEPGDEHFTRVPASIPIIQKGPSFGDDLFTALDNLFLI